MNVLTHIVCWKYKAETSDAQRMEHVERLQGLSNVIPDTVSFSVGRDILKLDRSFDTGLVAVYPDRDALARYTDHPEHMEVAAFGREIAAKVVSVDFIS